MMQNASKVLAGLGALVISAPAPANQSPYNRPKVIAAGSAKQMASAAKAAINCGIDFVTVRPWKDGDISGFSPSMARPMSLIIQVLPESDLDKVLGCFDKKMGWDSAVIA